MTNTDTFELIDRYNQLAQKYLKLVPVLADHLENYGRLRQELQLLTVELKKRGVVLKEEENEAPDKT